MEFKQCLGMGLGTIGIPETPRWGTGAMPQLRRLLPDNVHPGIAGGGWRTRVPAIHTENRIPDSWLQSGPGGIWGVNYPVVHYRTEISLSFSPCLLFLPSSLSNETKLSKKNFLNIWGYKRAAIPYTPLMNI